LATLKAELHDQKDFAWGVSLPAEWLMLTLNKEETSRTHRRRARAAAALRNCWARA